MTRDQAICIMQNLEIIRAFAEGKELVFPINGRNFPVSQLILGNFKSDRPLPYQVVQDDYEFETSPEDWEKGSSTQALNMQSRSL